MQRDGADHRRARIARAAVTDGHDVGHPLRAVGKAEGQTAGRSQVAVCVGRLVVLHAADFGTVPERIGAAQSRVDGAIFDVDIAEDLNDVVRIEDLRRAGFDVDIHGAAIFAADSVVLGHTDAVLAVVGLLRPAGNVGVDVDVARQVEHAGSPLASFYQAVHAVMRGVRRLTEIDAAVKTQVFDVDNRIRYPNSRHLKVLVIFKVAHVDLQIHVFEVKRSDPESHGAHLIYAVAGNVQVYVAEAEISRAPAFHARRPVSRLI